MMRWNTFARSLGFAALAAGGVLPWLVLARPIFGAERALAVYLVGAVAVHLGGLVRSPGRRVVVSAVTAMAGTVVALVAQSLPELALGLGIVLAVGRSGFLYRAPAARAVVTEAALVVGGLVFARLLAGRSPLALVLPVWGFFLVQSAYFLIGGPRARTGSGRHPDAFEDAHGRALALLERRGV